MGYESTSSGCSVSSNWEKISWHWNILYEYKNKNVYKGRRGRDRTVVGSTTI